MTKEEKQEKKEKFLHAFKIFDCNFQKSCKAIGVSKPTIHRWLKLDEDFKNKYNQIEDYNKSLLKDLSLKKKRKINYPYNEMEIGDSFLIPCHIVDINTWRGRFNTSSTRYKQKNNCLHKKFSAKVVEGGLRIWRLK